MSAAKLRACSTSNTMNNDPKIFKQEKEGQVNVDNLIQQAMGNEPFLSFSRAHDSPVHLIQLLHSFDQQGNGKLSKSLKGDNDVKLMDNSLELCNNLTNGNKETANSLNCFGAHIKGMRSASPPMQNLKIPDAVVAFAKAAAKASGDPEKLDISGWPFVSPSKTQLQKCDKCSREFCSSINYRRHIRVHRRSLNVDKDSPKNKDFLGAFWDKLSVEEAKELVSLKNVFMEEVTGPAVIQALSTWLRWPGIFSFLSPVYIKAGLMLLEVVQASSSVFPISSQELFRILDDASEKTFLCAGTALSLQKNVFDGEAGKNALEMKNLIACTSFLIEKELVKTWLVNKDAEALRCQKLLFEEEEAAQKRKAELVERKRLKKLRQKEQKEKETLNGTKDDFKAPKPDSADCTGSTETSSPRASSEYCTSEVSTNLEQQLLDSTASSDAEGELRLRLSSQYENSEKNKICQAQTRNCISGSNAMTDRKSSRLPLDSDGVEQDLVYQTQLEIHHQQPNHVRQWIYSKPTRNIHEAIRAVEVSSVRSSVTMRSNNYRNLKAISPINGHKFWTIIKSLPDNEEDGKNGQDMLDREPGDEPVVFDRSEVLIGSINVTLGNGDGHHPYTILKPQMQEKTTKSSLNSSCRTSGKQWRPVSRHGNDVVIQNDNGDAKVDVPCCKSDGQMLSDECCVASGVTSDADFERCEGPMLFSSTVAKAFLAQRWKEAISRDHVVIASSPKTEAFHVPDAIKDRSTASPQQASFHAENQLERAETIDPISVSSLKLKLNRPKAEKASKFKYVPKQKVNAVEE